MTDAAQPPAAVPPQAPAKQLETEEEILRHYNALRQDQGKLMSRIAELDGERHEHALVLQTLKPLEPTRRCHRLVGGALVERTVATVTPEVENALAQIDNVLKNFNEQLVKKDRELESFAAQYKITTKKGGSAPVNQAGAAEGARGVLA
jgi:prefoldin subunit 2